MPDLSTTLVLSDGEAIAIPGILAGNTFTEGYSFGRLSYFNTTWVNRDPTSGRELRGPLSESEIMAAISTRERDITERDVVALIAECIEAIISDGVPAIFAAGIITGYTATAFEEFHFGICLQYDKPRGGRAESRCTCNK